MKKALLTVLLASACIITGAQTFCKATTKKGTQCNRKVVIQGYCKQHYKISIKDSTGKKHPGNLQAYNF